MKIVLYELKQGVNIVNGYDSLGRRSNVFKLRAIGTGKRRHPSARYLFGNKTWLDGCQEDEPIKFAITLGESLHDFGCYQFG